MFLCSLNRLTCHSKARLAILVTIVVPRSNFSSGLHLLGVVNESLNCRPKELQSFRLTLRQERRVLSWLEVSSWARCLIAIAVALNNIFDTSIGCRYPMCVGIMTIPCMSASCGHHSLLALFLLLNCFSILLSC